MDIYEFDKQDAYRFARNAGARAYERGDELVFTECPYCHGGQHRDKNTFSINTKTGQFQCKRASCGVSGNMLTIARDFGFSLGTETDRYINRKEEEFRFRKFGKRKVTVTDPAIAYLKGRGISEGVARRYKIASQKNADNIIVFPFFDKEGNLVTVKYRKADFNPETDRNKEWFEKGCKPILFGMEQCEDFEYLVVTEGQIDSLSVAEAGIKNAVSVPNGANGFTWVPYCWDWIRQFKKIIVFGDNEKSSMTLLPVFAKREFAPTYAVNLEDYKGCKDANEILQKFGQEAIRQAVENAQPLPVKRVKRLADVESVDIYSMPKIKTGVRELDMLIGGLYRGQVVLLTGKRGGGKSTFASQILVSALSQNKKIFAYSGELQDYYFKRWIDLQIAGRRNIVQGVNQYGEQIRNITKTNIDMINAWYYDRAFIYDNTIVDGDEMEDLLKTVEQSIVQYGIDIILIDNLMTAISADVGSDLYRAQSQFVNRLCKLAKKHDVVILLIVHPRKNSYGNDENDEVSGSADITNRVDVVMTYKRDKNLLPHERYLSVSKNRLTGRLTRDTGIKLYYDDVSKRISDTENGFNVNYGWQQGDRFEEYTGDEPLPFD